MALFAGVEHFAVAARDTERLARWYAAALQFAIWKELDNGPGLPKTYFVRLGEGSFIEVFAAERAGASGEKPNTEAGWVHLAIAVTDFDAADAHLQRHGARLDGPIRTLPNGTRVRFYRDPEGNLFHIVHRPAPL